MQMQMDAAQASARASTPSPASHVPHAASGGPEARDSQPSDVTMSAQDLNREAAKKVGQGKKLSGELLAKMRSLAADVRKAVTNAGRSKVHLERLTNELEIYKEGRAPPNGRLHKLPFTSEIYQDVISDQTKNMPFTFAEQSTFEMARAHIHYQACVHLCAIDFEVEERILQTWLGKASFDGFVDECLAISKADVEMIKRASAEFGAPAELFEDFSDEVRNTAANMYAKLCVESAKDLDKDKMAKEKQCKENKAALDDASKLGGAEVLKKVFFEFTRQAKRRGTAPESAKVDFLKMLDLNVKQPTLQEPSPGTSSNNPRPIPKAKPKAKSKGKGQGAQQQQKNWT